MREQYKFFNLSRSALWLALLSAVAAPSMLFAEEKKEITFGSTVFSSEKGKHGFGVVHEIFRKNGYAEVIIEHPQRAGKIYVPLTSLEHSKNIIFGDAVYHEQAKGGKLVKISDSGIALVKLLDPIKGQNYLIWKASELAFEEKLPDEMRDAKIHFKNEENKKGILKGVYKGGVFRALVNSKWEYPKYNEIGIEVPCRYGIKPDNRVFTPEHGPGTIKTVYSDDFVEVAFGAKSLTLPLRSFPEINMDGDPNASCQTTALNVDLSDVFSFLKQKEDEMKVTDQKVKPEIQQKVTAPEPAAPAAEDSGLDADAH